MLNYNLNKEQIKYIEQTFIAAKENRRKFLDVSVKGQVLNIKRKEQDDVEVILYYPKNFNSTEKLPVYVNMHGGAWLAGDARSMETFSQHLADKLTTLVVNNVNYKKVDEKPFPYATEEVVDVVKYFIEHEKEYGINFKKIIIGGFSAGGQIAATASIKLKDDGIALAGQVLIYPCTKLEFDNVNEENPMNLLVRYFFPNGGNEHPYVSPLLAKDEELENLCPTTIIICGRDSLKTMAFDYAKRLINLGVYVNVKEYPQALHGFIEVNQPEYPVREEGQTMDQKEYCEDAINYIINELKAKFNEVKY